jgi:prepilin-type N-terminal cleavage/methylation domain-containing protein
MKQCNGFTLIEIAVVLVVLGLMLGGLLIPISAQLDQRNYAETRRAMGDIREALLGFAMANGHLPCPAISVSDGREDRASSGLCNKRAGFLPWADLGLPKLDGWGHLYRYSATQGFIDASPKVSLTTPPDMTIKSRDVTGASTNLTNNNTVVTVVLSFGKNGRGGYSDTGLQAADGSTTNADEDANTSGTTAFFSRELTANTAAPGGEFDDLVLWIPASLYFNRMVSAAQLP